jgi:phosphomannomutase
MRTKIGSPYVIEAFSELVGHCRRIAGFEANGGFLLGSDIDVNKQLLTALPTRDALLPALAVLALAGSEQVSSLLSSLPNSFTASDRLQNFSRENSLAFLLKTESDPKVFLNLVGLSETSVISIDTTDGLRMTLSDNTVVHLRPSGNAPELRCYAEASSQIEAEKLVKKVLESIST